MSLTAQGLTSSFRAVFHDPTTSLSWVKPNAAVSGFISVNIG
ncbi:MAG: hypothetical protein QW784_03530 [Acidilobaceae archaeon]